MELELGLGLGLGLALPSPHQAAGGGAGFLGRRDGAAAPVGACGKRVFGEAFCGGADKATPLLPLFGRDGDGGGGDGGDDRDTSNKRKRLVGWPPVKCAHYTRSCGGVGAGYVKVKMEGVAIGRKVDVSLHGSYDELLRTLGRMFPSAKKGAGADAEEGEVVVAEHERRHRGHHYVVTYEDGEGDWLLVGDVPWEAFAKSVKRLKILA